MYFNLKWIWWCLCGLIIPTVVQVSHPFQIQVCTGLSDWLFHPSFWHLYIQSNLKSENFYPYLFPLIISLENNSGILAERQVGLISTDVLEKALEEDEWFVTDFLRQCIFVTMKMWLGTCS